MLTVPLRIVVVDDFEPWRNFLLSFLREKPNWNIVAEATDGIDAIEACRQHQPDLVLLDIGLARLNGIEAAKEIRKLSPASKILFLSAISSPEIVREAFKAGGRGFVVKSDAPVELFAAIEAVIANKKFLSSRFAAEEITGCESETQR